MRAMSLLPNDPRARDMNLHQWLWCYYNIIEDQKEEQERFKNQLDRLAFIVNPEVAKNVFEHEEKEKSKKGSRKKYNKEAIYNNDVFDMETRAAMLGYDPSMGISVEEFLSQYGEREESINIFDDDIDTLMESDEFDDVFDGPSEVGNPNEEPEDFFERAMMFQETFEGEEISDMDLDIFEVDEE
jgi:hypothetical protein